jgi:putative hydrolase of the HAD superfamily
VSILAEFAADLQRQSSQSSSIITPSAIIPSARGKLYDIQAVIFDVYGTLVNYWKNEFSDESTKTDYLKSVFEKTIERFSMRQSLERINPDLPAAQTLFEFYHSLITLSHQKAREKGIEHPEVNIDAIWGLLISLLKRHGYNPSLCQCGSDDETARCMAYFYHFYSIGRGFYPGVCESLKALKKQNINIGIVSNAQFYTPVDLTLFTREQSLETLDDYLELFDVDLLFYSYEYGVSKPDPLLFRKLYDTLYEMHILPSQTVFVGNDLAADIAPAAEIGMKTAFFYGDTHSAFTHDLAGTVVPDICFSSWDELPRRVSFFAEKTQDGSVN